VKGKRWKLIVNKAEMACGIPVYLHNGAIWVESGDKLSDLNIHHRSNRTFQMFRNARN